MTYTNNLELQHATIELSASIGSSGTSIFSTYNKNIQTIDELLGYYSYDIESDNNISITTNSIFIEIFDTGNILTSNKTLSITYNGNIKLLYIKNSTNYTLTYSGISILSDSIKVLYGSTQISLDNSDFFISDLYSFTKGKPSTYTILANKKVVTPSRILGGYAKSRVAATNTTTIDIKLLSYRIGFIRFSAGSSIGIITLSGSTFIDTNTPITIVTQGVSDATLEDIGITLNIQRI